MGHVGNYLNRILGRFGLEFCRRDSPPEEQSPRASIRGCLEQAIRNGLHVETVIDVGVAMGTPDLYDLFPGARFILVEPLQEYASAVQAILARLPRGDYVSAAAGSRSGEVVLHVHPDLGGSSLFEEQEESDVNGVERTVSICRLDDVCQEKETGDPIC